MDAKNKIKVVWICHFSNENIRELLKLSKLTLHIALKRIFKNEKAQPYRDFAPWVTNLAKEFERIEDIELHIISPHRGLIKNIESFAMNKINYHFFKPDLPLIYFNITNKLLYMGRKPKYYKNRYLIRKIIKQINPDIINLIGAENPYYSISSLDIKNIPVYVACQTVYSNPARKEMGDSVVPGRWETELKIHKKEKYFGCHGRMHHDLVLKNNPKATIFKMFFPLEKPEKVANYNKIYDFVFFAGIAKKKGVEDLIDALALVKKKKESVLLDIVGSSDGNYMSFLFKKVKELGLENNVVFHNYFPKHIDMHQHVVQAKFAVLPVKLDDIPGSVIEAIYLELPVVTYKTTGTPYLNKDAESVLIGDIGDIDMLANNMIKLLEDEKLGNKLKKNALEVVNKEFDNKVSAMRFVSNYKAIIENYNHQTEIPKEQLFNLNEFPIY